MEFFSRHILKVHWCNMIPNSTNILLLLLGIMITYIIIKLFISDDEDNDNNKQEDTIKESFREGIKIKKPKVSNELKKIGDFFKMIGNMFKKIPSAIKNVQYLTKVSTQYSISHLACFYYYITKLNSIGIIVYFFNLIISIILSVFTVVLKILYLEEAVTTAFSPLISLIMNGLRWVDDYTLEFENTIYKSCYQCKRLREDVITDSMYDIEKGFANVFKGL